MRRSKFKKSCRTNTARVRCVCVYVMPLHLKQWKVIVCVIREVAMSFQYLTSNCVFSLVCYFLLWIDNHGCIHCLKSNRHDRNQRLRLQVLTNHSRTMNLKLDMQGRSQALTPRWARKEHFLHLS